MIWFSCFCWASENFRSTPSDFAVSWIDLSAGPGVRGQVFDAYGLRLGGEFTVSTGALPATPTPGDLTLAELADGRIAVAWRGLDEDGQQDGRTNPS